MPASFLPRVNPSTGEEIRSARDYVRKCVQEIAQLPDKGLASSWEASAAVRVVPASTWGPDSHTLNQSRHSTLKGVRLKPSRDQGHGGKRRR